MGKFRVGQDIIHRKIVLVPNSVDILCIKPTQLITHNALYRVTSDYRQGFAKKIYIYLHRLKSYILHIIMYRVTRKYRRILYRLYADTMVIIIYASG